MRNRKKHTACMAFLLLLCCMLITAVTCTGCSERKGGETDGQDGVGVEIVGLTYSGTMTLDYAEQFAVYEYEDGYRLIDIFDDAQYLVVPEGGTVPAELDSAIKVIQQPVKNIYLAATASMSLFDAMNALDCVTMTSLNASGWTVENAKKAMESGAMVYAGKYNQPDYELILGKGCDLAIESTMIYHSPEVKEMLEELDIPVMVDHSSYETNPMGRTEWIKLYGVLTGRQDEAEAFFAEQKAIISELETFENTGKTVAFFYLTTDGKVVVRRISDYVPTMIHMAGGKYVFDQLPDEDGKASVSMTMESFYEAASQADYIVYNGSIDSTVKTVEDLLNRDAIFENFKAVKAGHCYNTGNAMYQRTDVISRMIMDFYHMLTEEHPQEMEFLTPMQ